MRTEKNPMAVKVTHLWSSIRCLPLNLLCRRSKSKVDSESQLFVSQSRADPSSCGKEWINLRFSCFNINNHSLQKNISKFIYFPPDSFDPPLLEARSRGIISSGYFAFIVQVQFLKRFIKRVARINWFSFSRYLNQLL
ncbi:hypothetical protein AVEN_166792-1 [Araneus ventricosus]|uniref:Uncharacterized protein n=1 Tax=Araneus ventricosus TaxID=182803 RepID=A0A4Y2BQN3_ARAVE|nr:hypothetical protein AVEN_166792-1 [Araneus ventricosus]